MMKSYTEKLADFAAKVTYDDLSETAINDAKRLIIDTIATAIGSHYTDAGKMVVELGKARGGMPESTVLVTGDKTSCGNAAYVNSYLANFMDFDDIMCHAGGHFAQCAVFPALAMAERTGASGKDFIRAVTVGFEITTRIGLALGRNSSVDPETGKMELGVTAGQTWASFGAAGACGQILGFDGDQMAQALGLAGYSAPIPTIGRWVSVKEDSLNGHLPHCKYTNYGATAEAGVLGAMLVERGFTGDRSILDGPRGFWRIVGSAGFDYDKLVRDMGKAWNVSETSLKPYPAGRELHQPFSLFEKLMKENGLSANEIDEVNIRMLTYLVTQSGEYFVKNQIDTQMNVPYGIAMIALGYKPGPEWENPDRFQDPEVLAFIDKISVSPYLEGDQMVKEEQESGEWRGSRPCTVEVKAKGKRLYGEQKHAPGDPWYPEFRMTDEQLREKFRNLSIGQLRTTKVDKALDTMFALEELDDINELVGLLVA